MTLWRRFAAHLARPEPATPLALFRMCIGLTVLGTLLSAELSGAADVVWLRAADGGFSTHESQQWLVRWLGGHTAQTVATIMVAAGVSALGVATGTLTRASALICGQSLLALWSLSQGTGGGHDRLLSNALWLLVLIPSGATLSVDCRIRTGRWRDDTPRPAWGRTLVVFQLCVVYTSAGLHKLGFSWFPWGGYLAVHYALLHPSWARLDVSMLPLIGWLGPLTRASTAVSWIWEVTFSVSAWWLGTGRAERRIERLGAAASLWQRVRDPDVRGLYIVVGVGMHVTLLVMMELGPFSLTTMSFYWAFYRHHELARWLPGGARPQVA